MMRPLRVFVVDDHPMVVEGMLSMLSQQPSIEVAGHAMSAASCMGYFLHHTADVVLMDINLPDKSGIDLCKELKQKRPDVYILGISNFNQGSYVRQMIEKGASGYVLKTVSKEELLLAIETVSKGKVYMSHEAFKAMSKESERQQALPILTKREKEVLQLIAEGHTNPQIADKLFVSPSTVDSHRKNLLSKLEVNNTAALIKFAYENKLIEGHE